MALPSGIEAPLRTWIFQGSWFAAYSLASPACLRATMNKTLALPFTLALALSMPCIAATAQHNQPEADSGVFVSEDTLDAYASLVESVKN